MNVEEARRILANMNARDTPENMNRVWEQMGRDPNLEGRSMGLQPGGDAPSPMTMLDKLASTTARDPTAGDPAGNIAWNNVAKPVPVPIRLDSMSNGAAQNGTGQGNSNGGARTPVATAIPMRGVAPNTEPPIGSRPASSNAQPWQGEGDSLQNLGEMLGLTPNTSGEKPMSMEDFALAAGIPLGTAAVGYALYQKLASLDGTVKMQPGDIAAINTAANDPKVLSRLDDLYPKGQGPEHKARLMAEINAENAALGFKPKAPAPAEAAVDKVAADTAKPAPAIKPAKPTKAVPRTATSDVAGPTRDATVVDDGVAAAERVKTNAALKPAEKPAYPQHTPIPKEVLPGGPVEPQGEMRRTLNDLVEALKKSKIKRAP